MKYYRKIVNMLNSLLEFLGIILMAAMVLIIFYHVIMRYAFSNTPPWSEEVSLILMIWFTFIGVIIGVKEDIHIAIEMFMRMLPPKLFAAVEIIDKIIVFILCVLLVRYGYTLILNTSKNVLPATLLPASTIYVMLPVSGLMMAFVIIEQVIDKLRKEENTNA